MSPQSELKVGCASLTLLPHQKKSLGVYTNSLIGKKKKPLIPITQYLPYPPATVHTSDVMDTNPRTGKVKNQLLKLTQVPGR